MPFRTPLTVRHEIGEEWRLRRALREAGATAMTRALMWIAVRATAIAAGRFGRKGPPLPVKIGQVTGMATAGILTVGAPTAVAVVGRVFSWIVEWIVAIPWYVFERVKGRGPISLGRAGKPAIASTS